MTAEETESLCVRLELYAQSMRAGIALTQSARTELSEVLVWLATQVRLGGLKVNTADTAASLLSEGMKDG